MGNESGKARDRRIREQYFDKYLKGKGIDIGCGTDRVTPDCLGWDLPQGDAHDLEGLETAEFDWVYSSHCLEHLVDPQRALARWWDILRPGGFLLVVVPDEDLYEQGVWPSRFNPDHKWTFTAGKSNSWSAVSINVVELAKQLPNHKIVWVRTIDDGYDYSGGIWDRTHGQAEAHVEFLVHKLKE